ncbi:hypothetical protein LPB260_22625 [Pseudomonas sp. LPB0260]|nr:hypothetical protein LPB260_07675 [Pseudomonas sp. LPB0260]QLC77642.1 hypothetical protein LPB260_22625 [Pseudomonas sp. LPB0260]
MLSSPHWAFWGSLLLSFIAVLGVATVGKDAAFYLDIAQRSVEQGPLVAFKVFNWPWFPLLLAGTHVLTGLPLEASAYLWCAFFLAGTCALLVDCVRRSFPGAAPWACLVVLSVPAFNSFRSDILREYGFWFFSVLALWLALRWYERRSWFGAVAIQVSIVMAALFRLEAILLIAAINFCLLPDLSRRGGWMALLKLNALPIFVALVGLTVLYQQGGFSQGRIEYFLSMLNPGQVHSKLLVMAQEMSDAVLNKYSSDDAIVLLLSGMLTVIALSFIKLCGPFALPYLSRLAWGSALQYWRAYKPFALAMAIYVIVLLLFFIQERFINSRYTSYLGLLAVPLLSLGLWLFARAHSRMARVLVALAVLVMLDNVVSLSAKKTHYVEAGHWLSAHVDPGEGIYYDDSRIAYYAGWGYPRMDLTREQAMSVKNASKFRYFLIEAEAEEPWLAEWLDRERRQILSQFENRKGETVLIIGD